MALEIMRKARKALKLSQEKLAEELELSTSQISRFESGERRPRFDEMVKISNRLQIPIDILKAELDADNDSANEPIDILIKAARSAKPPYLKQDGAPPERRGELSEEAAENPLSAYLTGADKIPIYAGKRLDWGEMRASESPTYRVPRPWFLGETKTAFGLIVAAENMAPAIEPGDVIFVNPDLPARQGRDALFRERRADGLYYVCIGRLLAESDTDWQIRDLTPRRQTQSTRLLPKDRWIEAFLVVAKLVPV